MVAVPAIPLLEILLALVLAIIGTVAAVSLRESIYRLLSPLEWLGFRAWDIAVHATDSIVGWARGTVEWIVENAYKWVLAPAQNMWETQWRQRALNWWMVVRLFGLKSNVVWLRSAVGDWPGGASLTNRVSWLQDVANFLQNWRINFESWTREQVSLLNAAIAATISTLRGEIATARQDAFNYTNARESAVRTDLNREVDALRQQDAILDSRIQAAREYAVQQANNAREAANRYTDQVVTYTAEVLREYTNQRIAALRTELLDRLTALSNQLSREIEGVRDETRLALMQLVNEMVQADAGIRAELKQRVAELTAELERTRGELTAELRTAITDVMREIEAQRNRLENYLLAEAAALMALAGTLVGTLPEDVIAHIRRVAEEAQAARAVAAVGLGIAIASIAARVAAVEAEFLRLRRGCIDPTCRAWLPSALLKSELNDLIAEGVMLTLILSLLSDPRGTAAQLRAFAEPVAMGAWSELRQIIT